MQDCEADALHKGPSPPAEKSDCEVRFGSFEILCMDLCIWLVSFGKYC